MSTAFTGYAFGASGVTTGATRTMPDRLNDIINVKDFGATGDGTTDDTDAIKYAINYAYSVHNTLSPGSRGGTVFIPAGTYNIGSPPLIIGPTCSLTITANLAGGVSTIPVNRIPPWLFVGMSIVDLNHGSALGGAIDNETLITGINAGALTVSIAPATTNSAIAINSVLPLNASVSDQGCMNFIGAGKDVTILTGTSSFFVVVKAPFIAGLIGGASGGNVNIIADMTIQNQSTAADSGALWIFNWGVNGEMLRCKMVGVIGLQNALNGFGSKVSDSVFINSAAITRADNATLSPLPGSSPGGDYYHPTSYGCCADQGLIIDCKATGYDAGFVLTGTGCQLLSCQASRCINGVLTAFHNTLANSFDLNLTGGMINSNIIDRCQAGIWVYNTGGSVIAGNSVTGTQGPYDPAPVTLSRSGTTVTATAASAHNLPGGTYSLVLITSPTDWTPGNTGNELVTITQTGATTFTYTLSSSPSPFASAYWNYPIKQAIKIKSSTGAFYASNYLPATASVGSFDSGTDTGTSQTNVVLATQAPYGWIYNAGEFRYQQCWTTSHIPPVAILNLSDLGLATGAGKGYDSFTIIDAALQGSFGGTVTGGSSHHYKVRSDTTNWIRIG